jgi:hypothetical protein
MARQFLTAIDLAKNEIQNAVVQNLASAPGSPVEGLFYFDDTDKTLKWYDGTAWQSAKGSALGAVTAQTSFGAASNNGAASTVSRSDHVHGTPAMPRLDQVGLPTANVSMNGFNITGLLSPNAIDDAANKGYVDIVAQGLDPKGSVKAATTANLTRSAPQTVDTIALIAGDRVLVKNQTAPAENGIFVVAAGAWTRATDMDSWNEVPGASTFVEQGTQAATGWVCTSNQGGTLNTTAITWTQNSGAGEYIGGNGLTLTGNTFAVGAGTGVSVAADTVGVVFAGSGSVDSAARSDHGHTDLVPTSRVITTGPGLTIGGGASADLSANRTINLSTFTSGVQGGVPASGGGTSSFLRADGTWAAPAGGGTVNKYAADVGGSTAVVLTHGLSTRDVTVEVYRNSTPWDTIECDVERTSTTQVTLRFAVAPAAAAYRAVVTA